MDITIYLSIGYVVCTGPQLVGTRIANSLL